MLSRKRGIPDYSLHRDFNSPWTRLLLLKEVPLITAIPFVFLTKDSTSPPSMDSADRPASANSTSRHFLNVSRLRRCSDL